MRQGTCCPTDRLYGLIDSLHRSRSPPQNKTHQDGKIQAAIRKRFAGAGATVLMIAHRLDSIIDADLVLMLADGKVLEAGHPYELLATAKGLPVRAYGFRCMVHQTGPETEAALKRAACKAWEASGREGGGVEQGGSEDRGVGKHW